MTPTETAKLSTLSALVLRDEDRRTDVVELAKLGRVAGKVLGEMGVELSAARGKLEAIDAAKDVVTRFAASLAGSVNGDEYAWALEDMKRDAKKWREATAVGAMNDETLRLYGEEVAGASHFRGVRTQHMRKFAAVVRERVQAQCAARLADTRERARVAEEDNAAHVADLVKALRIEPSAGTTWRTLINLVQPVGAQSERREPRPGEVWATQGGKGERYIVLPERWESGLYAGYQLRCEDGSPTALCINDMANARAEMGWTFVRNGAEPTPSAPAAAADDDAIALWLRSDEGLANGDGIGTADVAGEAAYAGDVRRLARAFTALVGEVRGWRRAGDGGVMGGGK